MKPTSDVTWDVVTYESSMQEVLPCSHPAIYPGSYNSSSDIVFSCGGGEYTVNFAVDNWCAFMGSDRVIYIIIIVP